MTKRKSAPSLNTIVERRGFTVEHLIALALNDRLQWGAPPSREVHLCLESWR